MISIASPRHVWLLSLAAGFALLSAAALAQAPPTAATDNADEAEEETAAPSVKKDEDPLNKEDLLKDVDIDKLDWSQLNVDASTLNMPSVKQRATAKSTASGDASWSSNAKGNGASSVSVKQSISPFWDTRVGADMTVVNPAPGTTSGDLLRQKISIWDKTSVEARVDPGSEQGKLGTSISKSVPLGDSYSLTLQNGYNVIQQGLVPVPGVPAHPSRNYETDQSAKLAIGDTGTSFTAGRSLSSSDDKWLGKVGAEQKLFDGVTISGSIGETASGGTNKSFGAGFKRSW